MKMPKIKVHYSLIFLILISLLTGSTKQIIIILFSIFFHEIGHLFFLVRYHCKIDKIEFSILGGIMTIDKSNLSLKKKLFTNLGGVFANTTLILISLFFNKIASLQQMSFIITYNLFMILFNLIPMIPLDGYQIVNDILSIIYEEEYTFYIVKLIDIIFLIILIILILYFKIYGLLIIWTYLLYKLIINKKDHVVINKYYQLFKK